MGSLNAFANGQPHRDELDDGRPPAKRVRLAEDVIASIHHQLADVESSLEVDHMILDYVAYHTVEACLSSRGQDTQTNFTAQLPSTLSMSDTFLAIFKAKHPDFRPDAEMEFRILLLKFTALFTQRLTSNPTTLPLQVLRSMREANTKRARAWVVETRDDTLPKSGHEAFSEGLPISNIDLDRNRAHVLKQLDIPPEDELYEETHYGTSSSASLLDLIPTFMHLTAARCAMSYGNLTDAWMQLAVEFMLQACLEQYLVYGAQGSGAFLEAFAWGYNGKGEPSSAKEAAVNEMFEDQDYAREVAGWSALKTSYQQLLLSPLSDSQTSDGITKLNDDSGHHVGQLKTIAGDHPVLQFEESMLEFLSGLARSISEPVLVQLERGCLDGMDRKQTAEFVADCGVDVAAFFSEPTGFKSLSC